MNTPEITREQAIQIFPNLETLHLNTKFDLFKELKDTGLVELTLFYKEPDEEKMRIDAVFRPKYIEPRAEDIRITSFRKAVGAVT